MYYSSETIRPNEVEDDIVVNWPVRLEDDICNYRLLHM